jgi:type II secretory pathway pseudopilin PulG
MSRGFTLIELVVASALVVVVCLIVVVLASSMRRAFDHGLLAGESVARARTALHAILSEAQNAGSGVVIGPTNAALEDVMPVITLVPPSMLAIARASGPQGLLRDATDAGVTSIRVDHDKPCSEQDATCGIRAHDVIAVFDATKGETARVASVDSASGTLHVALPLLHAFDAGAVVAAIEQRTFLLSGGQLLRVSSGGAQQPIADRVRTFNAIVAARRLDVQLSLEPAGPSTAPLEWRTAMAFRR